MLIARHKSILKIIAIDHIITVATICCGNSGTTYARAL